MSNCYTIHAYYYVVTLLCSAPVIEVGWLRRQVESRLSCREFVLVPDYNSISLTIYVPLLAGDQALLVGCPFLAILDSMFCK